MRKMTYLLIFLLITTQVYAFTLKGLTFVNPIKKYDLTFFEVTDVHYDKDGASGASSTSNKNVREAVSMANVLGVDMFVQLGDMIDSDTTQEDELINLQTMEDILLQFNGDVYSAIGNHDLEHITKEVYVANSRILEAPYYSFDKNGFHIVFAYGGELPYFEMSQAQLDWLTADLASSDLPTIIFHHFRIDQNYPGNPSACLAGDYDPPTMCYSAFMVNSEEMRAILEQDGDVIAVFQGHHHLNAYAEVNGIKYFTFPSTNSKVNTSMIGIKLDGTINVFGYGDNLTLKTYT